MTAFLPITPEQLASHKRFVDAWLRSVIRAHVVKPVGGDVVDTVRYLEQCRNALTGVLLASASAYSHAAWLWYLRRLPDVAFRTSGDLTRGDYNRNLAEVLTTIASDKGTEPTPLQGEYQVSPAIADDVVRFVCGVRYLGNILTIAWNASRGVQLTLDAKSDLPRELWTPEGKKALRLYAHRSHETGSRFLARAGTGLGSVIHPQPRSPHAVLTISRIPNRWLDLDVTFARGLGHDKILQCYRATPIDIGRISQFGNSFRNLLGDWPTEEFGAVALTLRLLYLLAPRYAWAWASTLSHGYISIEYDMLPDWFQTVWVDAVSDIRTVIPDVRIPTQSAELCSALSKLNGSVVPMRHGRLLRIDGNLALLDIAGLTSSLSSELDFVYDRGRVANVRARQFELSIQEAVNASPWTVVSSVRQLIGRTLRLQGKAITDVDALATKDGRLLFISAKSMVYTRAHASGEYRSIRNAATAVIKACDEAREISDIVKRNPKGDNYDISGFDFL